MTHDNSDRFLVAFSRIEQSLRKMTKSSKQDSFGTLLDRATSTTIRRFSNDLREFAELRNAIVHERGGGYEIAEPHPETVHRLEEIEQLISQPPVVESLGDFRERFSTGVCSVFACVDIPPAGGCRWGAAAVGGQTASLPLPTSFPPPTSPRWEEAMAIAEVLFRKSPKTRNRPFIRMRRRQYYGYAPFRSRVPEPCMRYYAVRRVIHG